MQSRLQSLSIDSDRRLITIQQTHEEEKQLLLTQIQQSSNQIKQLEKDLFFYKHKSRELRKSMATSITNINEISSQNKQLIVNQDDLRISRTDTQRSIPFILNTGNRSNSAHQS